MGRTMKIILAVILAIILTGCATYDMAFNKPPRYAEAQ